MKQSSINRKGFTIIELLPVLVMGGIIFSSLTLLTGMLVESKSEKSYELDGKEFFRMPSQTAFIKAIELNFAFAEQLSLANSAMGGHYIYNEDKLRLAGDSLIKVNSSERLLKLRLDLLSAKTNKGFSVALFQEKVWLGLLKVEQYEKVGLYFIKVTFLTQQKTFSYGIFTASSAEDIYSFKNEICGDSLLNLETEWIEMTLPNPMSSESQVDNTRFAYSFAART